MIHICIDFVIKKDASLDMAHGIIRKFLHEIKANEPDTLMYRSLYDMEPPQKFTHIMTFANEKAQLQHRNSHYCEESVSKLYPLCTEAPVARTMNELLAPKFDNNG